MSPLSLSAAAGITGVTHFLQHSARCSSAHSSSSPGRSAHTEAQRTCARRLGPLAHWVLVNGTLFPYALGLAVVPGAILGLGYMIVKPRNKFDRATATLTVGCLVLFIGQAALVSTAEAHRPLERYLFYCTPLVFLAFFSYVERGAPRRFMYVALGLVGALALSRFQLTGLTGTTAYFFDGITLTGFARVAFLMGLTNAALLYALIPLALALLAWALPLRKRGVPELFASLAIGLSLAAGVGVYATDSLATSWAARTFGSKQMDWLDRSNLGPARQLILPRSNIFARASLETWNRNFSGVVVLATDAPDRLARGSRPDPHRRHAGDRRRRRRRANARRQHRRKFDRPGRQGRRASSQSTSSPTASPPARTCGRSPGASSRTAGWAPSYVSAPGRAAPRRPDATSSPSRCRRTSCREREN